MTPEIKQDLKVLQMRNFIFKDKFYKKSDPLPKYFQVVSITVILDEIDLNCSSYIS